MSEYSAEPFEEESGWLLVRLVSAVSRGASLPPEVKGSELSLELEHGRWKGSSATCQDSGDSLEFSFPPSEPPLRIDSSALGLEELRVRLSYLSTQRTPRSWYEGSTFLLELKQASSAAERVVDVITRAGDSEETLSLQLRMSVEVSPLRSPDTVQETGPGALLRVSSTASRGRTSLEQVKAVLGRRISQHLKVIRRAREERDNKLRPVPPAPRGDERREPARKESVRPVRRSSRPRKLAREVVADPSEGSLDKGSASSRKRRPKLIVLTSPLEPTRQTNPLTRLESRKFSQVSDFQRGDSGHHLSLEAVVRGLALGRRRSDLSSKDLATERDRFRWETLVRWNFAIPFDTRNCVVEIAIANDVYNENFYYSVSSSTPPYRKFSSGAIPIDLAFDLTHRVTTTTTEEDLYAMRSLFHNLFQQADRDHSGSLSFLEVQSIVERINVGLSPQEISLIIAAADVDASGEVDYNEFVPLAVDMVHTMRTKAKAKQRISDISESVTDLVLKALDTKELDRIARLCMDYILAAGI